MKKQLMEKLRRIARHYNKNEDFSVYVRDGSGMWIDEMNQQVKFNHIASIDEARSIADEIVTAFLECGYKAQYIRSQQLSKILFEYIISYEY